jgi:hypothetical protein
MASEAVPSTGYPSVVTLAPLPPGLDPSPPEPPPPIATMSMVAWPAGTVNVLAPTVEYVQVTCVPIAVHVPVPFVHACADAAATQSITPSRQESALTRVARR